VLLFSIRKSHLILKAGDCVRGDSSVAVESNAFLKDSVIGCCISHLGNKEYVIGNSLKDALENATRVLGVSDLSECEYDVVMHSL